MSGQVSRGSAGEYQADEQAVVPRYFCFNAYLKRNWDLVLVGTNGINGTLICVNGTSVPLTAENGEVINQTHCCSK